MDNELPRKQIKTIPFLILQMRIWRTISITRKYNTCTLKTKTTNITEKIKGKINRKRIFMD